MKIYRVDKGEISEVIQSQQISENTGDINKNTSDSSSNNNSASNNSNNCNETKNIENNENNIAIKEKESCSLNNNILNIKNIENKSNKFNFELNLEKDYKLNDKNNNNSNNSAFKFNNSKKVFTFENEAQNPNNYLNLFFNKYNINKSPNNKDKNDELNDIRNSGIGLSSMFQQK